MIAHQRIGAEIDGKRFRRQLQTISQPVRLKKRRDEERTASLRRFCRKDKGGFAVQSSRAVPKLWRGTGQWAATSDFGHRPEVRIPKISGVISTPTLIGMNFACFDRH